MKIDEIRARTEEGMHRGNGYMAWVENDVLRSLLSEVERLEKEQAELLEFHERFGEIEAETILQLTARAEKAEVDAVQVVRCRDCKRYAPPVVSRDTGVCTKIDKLVKPDDFCSCGERKEATT